MAWFVVYELRGKNETYKHGATNVILRKTHPVIWAACQPKVVKDRGYVTFLLFFKEIPDECLTAEVDQWASIED